jgi:hypothetical protein
LSIFAGLFQSAPTVLPFTKAGRAANLSSQRAKCGLSPCVSSCHLQFCAPGRYRQIGNREEIARHKPGRCQLPVEHAAKAAPLAPMAILRTGLHVRRVHLGRMVLEVMRPAPHRPHAPDLPHQPLIHGNPVTFGGATEMARLARRVLQDGLRLTDRHQCLVRTVRIDNPEHPVVRCDSQQTDIGKRPP